jgi:hypothetical protein
LPETSYDLGLGGCLVCGCERGGGDEGCRDDVDGRDVAGGFIRASLYWRPL